MASRSTPGFCTRCGVWRRRLHRDHIIPKALGGRDIQLLCANCHEDKTAEDFEKYPEMRALSVAAGQKGGAALAAKGYRHSPEMRAHLSEAQRAAHARRKTK